MSHAAKTRSLVLIGALLLVCIVAAISYFNPSSPGAPTQVAISFRLFRFGRSEVMGFWSEGNQILLTTTRHFGPVLLSRTEKLTLVPIGTNDLRIGEAIYDPASKLEVWRVLASEQNHEFDDETVRPGVRVRSTVNGGTAWLPKAGTSKALIAR